ncbi:orotate phosphoribosyltransferase [Fulvivirgaceae bacterium BMA10]|uniref:Orotate phosphoribosyltransferase n=1 Tax=Splendidivirga corallicola TaxID=3051826 RepID=A0ABT8KMF9_9BACT|nr:orotate phosphoribosyltransferase [Fulvivirgaceae bacterium BMA10]
MIAEKQNLEIGKKIASMLLDIEAIKLNVDKPFVWSSGWNSPIYCDNRLSLSFPQVRDYIKEQLVNLVTQNYPGVEAIAGVATAGIPQGALIADNMSLPYLYVRSKPKGHGMENLIEGKVTKGQKVVVVEDLVSTGGSSLKAAEALQWAGFEVLGMVAIFTYGFDLAKINFEKANLPLSCLSNYTLLIEEAAQRQLVSEDQISLLESWRKTPDQWGK